MVTKLVHEKVDGYEKFMTRVSELEKLQSKPKIFILFTGSESGESGKSWCPDCNDFEEVFEKLESKIDGIAGGSIFLRVLVGSREQWKDTESPFRKDRKLKLTSVPTLIDWMHPAKRLSDHQILNEGALMLLFED